MKLRYLLVQNKHYLNYYPLRIWVRLRYLTHHHMVNLTNVSRGRYLDRLCFGSRFVPVDQCLGLESRCLFESKHSRDGYNLFFLAVYRQLRPKIQQRQPSLNSLPWSWPQYLWYVNFTKFSGVKLIRRSKSYFEFDFKAYVTCSTKETNGRRSGGLDNLLQRYHLVWSVLMYGNLGEVICIVLSDCVALLSGLN